MLFFNSFKVKILKRSQPFFFFLSVFTAGSVLRASLSSWAFFSLVTQLFSLLAVQRKLAPKLCADKGVPSPLTPAPPSPLLQHSEEQQAAAFLWRRCCQLVIIRKTFYYCDVFWNEKEENRARLILLLFNYNIFFNRCCVSSGSLQLYKCEFNLHINLFISLIKIFEKPLSFERLFHNTVTGSASSLSLLKSV